MPQIIPFIELTIKSLDDDSYNRLIVDPSQNAIIYGQKIQIYIKESLSPFLYIWVVPKEVCSEIVFDLPNSSEYSVCLHSNIPLDMMCIFTPIYTTKFNQTVLYGLKSNVSDQLVLYSNQKSTFLNPKKICKDAFCRSIISSPSFFQLKHYISNVSSNTTSIFFSLLGEQKSKLPSILHPIPLYNYSGLFTFDDDYGMADFHEIQHPSKKKRFFLTIILILESVLMFFVIILKIFIRIMIYIINKKSNKKHENRDKRPLTVVLNQYCPNTSAMLISV